jgi:hypothetical protein
MVPAGSFDSIWQALERLPTHYHGAHPTARLALLELTPLGRIDVAGLRSECVCAFERLHDDRLLPRGEAHELGARKHGEMLFDALIESWTPSPRTNGHRGDRRPWRKLYNDAVDAYIAAVGTVEDAIAREIAKRVAYREMLAQLHAEELRADGKRTPRPGVDTA